MIDNAHSTRAAGRRESLWAIWAVVAAFGTYFCMYGFRKPFTAADFAGASVWGIDFKTVVVSTQVLGYMLSKFIGIKVISEMPPQRRAGAILVLIALAEAALVLFGAVPRPWNAGCLFLNGLALGMVFGLVLGFLEGRRVTEALVAGLCASFILADGMMKSVGTWLLNQGVAEDWMPGIAGLLFVVPLGIAVAMLARIPPPSKEDVAARTDRPTLSRNQRWSLYGRYAGGLSLLVAIYVVATVIRSIRADFAPELWRGLLGKAAEPAMFSKSEIWVMLGVLAASGLAVCIRDNRAAFFLSLATCCLGCVVMAAALIGLQAGAVGPFPFMVLIGLGLYLPYVAIHTTVFERLLAMTREHGNLGFLMYVADAVGYLGFVVVMVTRKLWSGGASFLEFFTGLCWVAAGLSVVCILLSWRYFAVRSRQASAAVPATEGAA